MFPGGYRRLGVLACVLFAVACAAGCGKHDEKDVEPQQSYVPRSVAPQDTTANASGTDTTAAAAAGRQAMTDAAPAPAGQAAAKSTAGAPTETGAEKLTSATPASGSAATAPRPRDTAREPAAGGPFSLQLGSFRRLDNARALMTRVEAEGYDPVLESVVLGGQTYHRVLLKGLSDRAAASRTGETLRQRLGVTYLVRQSD